MQASNYKLALFFVAERLCSLLKVAHYVSTTRIIRKFWSFARWRRQKLVSRVSFVTHRFVTECCYRMYHACKRLKHYLQMVRQKYLAGHSILNIFHTPVIPI